MDPSLNLQMAYSQSSASVTVENESGTKLTNYRLHIPSIDYMYLSYRVNSTMITFQEQALVIGNWQFQSTRLIV